MQTYNVSRLPSMISIGWDGENNWRPQAFDCTVLLANHPDGVITLWLLPKGAAQAFPVALERDGDTVVWTPLNEEMTAEHGQLQIVVQDGTDVGKSKVVDYTVHDSLVGGADHPAETPSWATQVVADVTEQADRAEEAAESIGESIGEQLPGAIADYLEEHPVTVTETDPTVPSWAKQPNKPTYTAAEVGALPDSYTPPVQSVNGKTGAVSLSASDVGALPDNTVIPTVPQMATDPDATDWTTGKTVDAAVLATDLELVGRVLSAKYTKPSGGIPDSDIASAATWNAKGTYSKPSGGIPASDMASAVQTSLGKADTAVLFSESQTLDGTQQWRVRRNIGAGTYSKPSGGIPASDLASDVQTSLGKADTALQEHQSLAGYATEQWVQNQGYLTQHQSLANYQTKSITDTGGYFTTDTVEGALQEIGAELAGVNTLIGSGVIS